MATQPIIQKTKKRDEEIPLIIDFRNELMKYTGQTLQVSGTSVVVMDTETGEDVSSDMLISSGISGTRLESVIRRGEEGKVYDVKFTGKTQTYKFIECIPLKIELCK